MAKNSSDFHDLQIRILQDFKDFDNINAKITTFSRILKRSAEIPQKIPDVLENLFQMFYLLTR